MSSICAHLSSFATEEDERSPEVAQGQGGRPGASRSAKVPACPILDYLEGGVWFEVRSLGR